VKWDRQRCGGCLGCSELVDCGKCIMCKSKGEQACIFRPCKLQPEEDRRRSYLYRKDFLKHGDRVEVGTRVYAKWHENEVSFLEFSSFFASLARSKDVSFSPPFVYIYCSFFSNGTGAM
jgi:hypothetical protein